METVTVHNLVIIDESGSMYDIRSQAIAGLNDTIGTVRAAQQQYEEQKHRLTLVTFSSGSGSHSVRYICDDQPINEVQPIDNNKYVPHGGTPLYDAIGTAVTKLDAQCKEGDQVIVTIITDGMENSSREFSGTAVKSIINLLREKGWVFAYIGANQDAVEVASELNIDNAMNYDASMAGAEYMFCSLNDDRKETYEKLSKGKRGKDLARGFFKKDSGDNLPF